MAPPLLNSAEPGILDRPVEESLAAVHAPHITHLCAALDAGLVPEPGAPVRYAPTADGLVVEVLAPAAVLARLAAAGLTACDPPAAWLEAPCWPAIIPLEPTAEPRPPLGEVLFMSTGTAGFLDLAAELIRLGCDQVAHCALGDGRVACRVPEPPYFAVLRALDPAAGIRAFQRRTAGIWIRLGWDHPRTQLILPAPQTLLLLDPAGWESLPDGPWTDVHQHLDVEVSAAHRPAVRQLDARLQVRLRLVRAPAMEPPVLWMITADARTQLDALVTTLPERVIEQLLFAVADEPEGARVCLRARRGATPILDVPGIAFAPYLQVHNLLVPVGHAVDPPLRLMRLRSLLAPDPQQLVLLEPRGEGGGFRPLVIDEDAFEPLSRWVDYVIGAAHVALDPWLADARFEFEKYVALDVEWSDGARQGRTARPAPEAPAPSEPRTRTERQRQRSQVVVTPPPLPVEALIDAPIVVDDARKAVATAEAAFCALQITQDDPALLPRWLDLGALQAAAGRPREAGLCWGQALWLADPAQQAALARRLVEQLPTTWAEVPRAEEVRGLAMRAIAGAAEPIAARQLTEQADTLDLRTWWLAQRALARRADDRLALMHARDHVFDRLKGGMPLAANVPTFIRMHGTKSVADGTDQLGNTLARLMQRYLETPRERSDIEAPPQLTECYVRLCVAWGFARLGQPDRAATQRAAALKCIPPKKMDGVHGLCIAMYDARIEQALAGRPPGAPLPPEIQARRVDLKRIDRFKADRMRELSRIIDPRRTFDPFEVYQKDEGHPFGEVFARLLTLPTPAAIAEQVDALLARSGGDKTTLLGIIDTLGTLPEALGVPRIRALLQRCEALPAEVAVEAIEELAVLAAALDRHDLISELLAALRPPAEALARTAPAELARSLARCAPILRGAGHGEALQGLVKTLEGGLAGGAVEALVARLEFAAAKAALGDDSGVRPAFDAVFGVLEQVPNKHDRFKHVRSLALAIGQTTPGTAIAGIERLWTVLPGVTDDFHTNSHFCLSVVQFMESIVLALASDALSLSEWARRWVETDEHLLRRRIHRDIA